MRPGLEKAIEIQCDNTTILSSTKNRTSKFAPSISLKVGSSGVVRCHFRIYQDRASLRGQDAALADIILLWF